MAPYKPPAVRVYTVCDESRYLVVRSVPALGCGDDLFKLFCSYGDVEECKPMDAEDCEPFTDVFWIKFRLVSNARFAKKKLDEFVFLGNRLHVSYAPQFESLSDTNDKLEGRRRASAIKFCKIQSASWFYPRCFNRGFTGHNSIRDQPLSKFLTNELHSPTVKF